jgi:hypothetical protein
VGSLFERLNKERPTAEANAVSPDLARKPIPAQLLLDWLLNSWTRPTVSARDIYRLGPNSIRDRQRVGELTEILVRQGWLTPNQTRRLDMHEWQIIRKPVIHPTISG